MTNKRKKVTHSVDRLRTQFCLHAVMNEFGGEKDRLLTHLNGDLGDSRALDCWLLGKRVLNKRSVNKLEQVSSGLSLIYRHELWSLWKRQLVKTGFGGELDQWYLIFKSESHNICDFPFRRSNQTNIILELLNKARISLSLLASSERHYQGHEFLVSMAFGYVVDTMIAVRNVFPEPVCVVWEKLLMECFVAHNVLIDALYPCSKLKPSKLCI